MPRKEVACRQARLIFPKRQTTLDIRLQIYHTYCCSNRMIGRSQYSLACKVIGLVATFVILFTAMSLYNNSDQDLSRLQSALQTIKMLKMSAQDSGVMTIVNKVSQPEVLRWDGQKWINWPNFCLDTGIENYVLADLHAPSGNMPFYVHDSKHDSYTSRHIQSKHTYEKSDLELMYRHLQEDQEMGLVDVGAHVGLYSATAALLGRKVLTVDALYMNNHAWCHSIVKNKFTNQVKQIYTIMSSEHRLMYFKKYGIHVGATTVHVAEDQSKKVSPMDKKFIHSATLDDLLPLITFKVVFLKLDVEKHELEVILGGERFFRELNVKYVLMEWIHHFDNKSRDNITEQMTRYGFKAFTAGSEEKEVDMTKLTRLYNIFWKKVL
ncbi:hypothetical protein LOTGIDRAFT_228862 [Lottia gigantea]|uniref:Methyltransferase FkbM domain-containing protein n=1 Tax=Lottia gigantea TaxID=225164 RepID=V4A451_LOTGI|nr:hypothetical protein LOTGIDRAFT_228862 [Lottia gigantea]ESO91462.1 hypothetical protein LOTGIDRAFT_228862 [Lottia gigantea]